MRRHGRERKRERETEREMECNWVEGGRPLGKKMKEILGSEKPGGGGGRGGGEKSKDEEHR